MRNKLGLALTVVVSSMVLGRHPAYAQQSEDIQLNTITTAVPFLMITGDARQMSLADVGVVSTGQYHNTAFTSNAALLANGHRYLATDLGYVPWLRALVPDMNIITHSVAGTINERNALGVHVKYFSLGNITFTDNNGGTIGEYNPYEFAVQVNYAHWFPFGLSLGVAGKYVYSNLTGGINVGGADTRPGMAGAADLGLHYRKKKQMTEALALGGSLGLGLNNIGSKMSYTNTSEQDFLPTNMMLGLQFSTSLTHGPVRFEHDVSYQVTKLLVPTPPLYDSEPYLNSNLPPGDEFGQIGHPSNANPNYGRIIAGRDPNRSVIDAMFTSFGDAPGGSQEEWREVIHQVSHEFRFILKDFFTAGSRQGFFYEHASKGNRQYVSLGAFVGVAGFRLDMGYFIPTQQRHPLENTLIISLGYRMVIGRPTKWMRFPKWDPEKEKMESIELKLDTE